MRWNEIVREDREVRWKAPHFSDYQPVWVDPEKIAASWAEDDNHYIDGPTHRNAIGKRYDRFGEWLQQGEDVEMSVLSLDYYDRVYFSNGRHRFAWMRNHGAQAIPVMVPDEQADEIKRRFGTGVHNTTVRVDDLVMVESLTENDIRGFDPSDLENDHDDALEGEFLPGALPATPENIEAAKAFVMEMWIERAEQLDLDEPTDLSQSCKFTSLFARAVFGGRLAGNYDHQFVVTADHKVIDLNLDAADVKRLAAPHAHDPYWWGNDDHRYSLDSCRPRVDEWVRDFLRWRTRHGSSSLTEAISRGQSSYWFNPATGETISCGDHGDAVQSHPERFGIDWETVDEMEEAWPYGSSEEEEGDFETQEERDAFIDNLPPPPAECGSRQGNDRNNCWEQLGMNRGWVRVGESVAWGGRATAAYFSTSEPQDFWKAVCFAYDRGGCTGGAELELCPKGGTGGTMAILHGDDLDRYVRHGRRANPFGSAK